MSKVFTINGPYRAYDLQICQFQGQISEYLLYLDINFDHAMEMDRSQFGMYWLASLCNTGHQHIVLLPVLGRRPDAWPVAFYDEESGAVETFASSITNWFPSYLIYLSEKPYNRRYFSDFSKELREHCLEHFAFDPGPLLEGRSSATMSTADAYRLTDEGSFLHRYWSLREANDRVGLRRLAGEIPFYNSPLNWLLQQGAADPEDCWEILHRPLRPDFSQWGQGFLARLQLAERAQGTPLEGVATMSDPAPYFLGAGQLYWESGQSEKAFACVGNALYLAQQENVAAEACRMLQHIVRNRKDRAYLSYLQELSWTSSG